MNPIKPPTFPANDRSASPRLRALIFDFDGVILDTESAIIEAVRLLHVRHGVSFDPGDLAHAAGSISLGDPWQAMPESMDRAQLWREHAVHFDQLCLQLPVLPGVRSWLETARSNGVPVGLASNATAPYLRAHLERLGLAAFFQAVSASDDVANPKPAPDVYLRSAQLIGHHPGDVLAVEDSSVGCQAARSAGLKVLAVPGPSTRNHDFSMAHRVIASLGHLTLDTALGLFGADSAAAAAIAGAVASSPVAP